MNLSCFERRDMTAQYHCTDKYIIFVFTVIWNNQTKQKQEEEKRRLLFNCES